MWKRNLGWTTTKRETKKRCHTDLMQNWEGSCERHDSNIIFFLWSRYECIFLKPQKTAIFHLIFFLLYFSVHSFDAVFHHKQEIHFIIFPYHFQLKQFTHLAHFLMNGKYFNVKSTIQKNTQLEMMWPQCNCSKYASSIYSSVTYLR